MTSLLLLTCAVLMAAHSISTANFMSRKAPITVAVEVVAMFGFSVGSIISGYDHNADNAAFFLAIALSFKALLMIDLLIRGYPLQLSLLTCEFDRHIDSYMVPRRRSTDREDGQVSH